MVCQRTDLSGAPSRPRSTPSCRRGAAAFGIALVLTLAGCSLGELAIPGEEEDWLGADPIQTTLVPAVKPVVDVLKQGLSIMNTDNMASTMLAMSSFQAAWDNASAVIKPFAGERWPSIQAAANRVNTIFDGNSIPEEATARPAMEDLMEKLQSLVDQ